MSDHFTRLTYLSSALMSKLLCLEESLPEKLGGQGGKTANRLVYLEELGQEPEALDKRQARRELGLDQSMRYMVLWG
jgi:hypothetical protein